MTLKGWRVVKPQHNQSIKLIMPFAFSFIESIGPRKDENSKNVYRIDNIQVIQYSMYYKTGITYYWELERKLAVCQFNLYHSLINFSRWQIGNIFLIFLGNRIWLFMQIVSIGDNLHEMLNPVSVEY